MGWSGGDRWDHRLLREAAAAAGMAGGALGEVRRRLWLLREAAATAEGGRRSCSGEVCCAPARSLMQAGSPDGQAGAGDQRRSRWSSRTSPAGVAGARGRERRTETMHSDRAITVHLRCAGRVRIELRCRVRIELTGVGSDPADQDLTRHCARVRRRAPPGLCVRWCRRSAGSLVPQECAGGVAGAAGGSW